MKLREILKSKNINQSVVAEALGINVNNIKRYDDLEKRSLNEIKIIADAIKMEMSELIRLINKDFSYILEDGGNKISDPEGEFYVEKILENLDHLENLTPEKREYIILKMIHSMTKAVLLNAENGKIANKNIEILLQYLTKIKSH